MRKNIQIPGLEPNSTYAIQLRGVDDTGNFGLWSTRLEFDTVKDEIAPAPVTNLAAEVDGADFVITWDGPTTDANGDELEDLRDYVVTITDGTTEKSYATVDETFSFTYSMNINQFAGSGEPSLDIDVQARDRVGNLSTIENVLVVNAAPGTPTLAAVAKRNAVELSWDDTFEDDGRRFEIWKNAAKYSEVGPGTLTWTDTDVGDGGQNYFIRAVDRFEQSTDSNTVTESEVELDTGDTVAPSAPTNAGYTDDAEGLTAIATLSWSAPTTDEDATSYTDQEGFDVRYRENAAGRPWNYEKVVDTRADGTTPQTFETEIEIDAGITLDWEVRAFDRFGNASGWLTSQNMVSQDTTPPNTPSVPTAVGNTQSIQVSHDLTDDTAATLGDNVVRLDIYVGTDSVFANMTKEGSVDVNRPSLGIDAVANIAYPVPDTDTSRFVRVVAISSAGIESTESAAASVTVGLVQNANIADATITNAKIDNVAANKLLAGTAFINDLFVESKLTVNVGGSIESDNFDATARTGWAVDDGNLYLFDGEIDASLIIIQQGANLIDNGYSNFLNDPDWYVDNTYTTGAATASISSAVWSRYGSQALRFQAAGTEEAFMAVDATDYNIPIESSVTYIISAYVYNNAGVAKSIRLRALLDATGSYNGFSESINAGEYKRISMTITPGATDTAMQVGFEAIDASSDFFVDGLQVEQQVGDLTDPSFFKVGGITTIGGGQITTGTIDANLANIVNINASNINTGTLDADLANIINIEGESIKAGSITTRELVVGSFDNLISDPGFESGTLEIWNPFGNDSWTIDTAAPRSGANAIRLDIDAQSSTAYAIANGLDGSFSTAEGKTSAAEGDKFFLEGWARYADTAPTVQPELRIDFRRSDGLNLATFDSAWPTLTTSYQHNSVTGQAPAGTAYVTFTIKVSTGNDSTVAMLFDDFSARKVVEAKIIGDLVIGENIKSDNYTAGSSGWTIDGDGSAEFNNATIRGDLEVGTDVILEIEERSPVGTSVVGALSWRDNGDYSGDGDAGQIYTANATSDADYPEGAARSLYIVAPYKTTSPSGARPYIEMSYQGSEILAESDALQIKSRLGEASFVNTQILLRDHGSGASRPQYSFIGDTATGIYRDSAGRVGVAGDLVFNNLLFAWMASGEIVLDNINEIRANPGGATDPSYTFTGAEQSGLYTIGDTPQMAVTGVREYHFSTALFTGIGDNTKNLGTGSHRWSTVYAVDGTINTSDMEQKEEFSDSDLGLDFVKKLRARKWRWQGRTRPHYGLFAQEVKQTLDNMGVADFAGYIDPAYEWEYNEEDPELSGEQPGPLGLRYHEFIGPLIKAVQELSAEVESLKAQMA